MINKESSGGIIPPDVYNSFLEAVNITLFNQKVGEARKMSSDKRMPFDETISVFKSLQEFRYIQHPSFTAGSAALPPAFAYWIKMSTFYNNQQREISILNDDEFSLRRTSLLAPKITEYPIGRLYNGNVYVLPTDIATAELIYLTQPQQPVFDYYLDSLGNVYPLSAGQRYTLTSGQVSSTGQTSGSVTSLTVELQWNPMYHMEFFDAVLLKVSARLQEQLQAQIAKDSETKGM
jgi:hypothetical protein